LAPAATGALEIAMALIAFTSLLSLIGGVGLLYVPSLLLIAIAEARAEM
jgi:hypothetical protein